MQIDNESLKSNLQTEIENLLSKITTQELINKNVDSNIDNILEY